MVTQPAYLKALRAYTKTRYGSSEDIAASVADLTNESDRGALILAATGVEDMLEYQIVAKLPGLHEDEAATRAMFEGDGPIASFSRKIAMAYALGILDKPYRRLTDLIREVRNACAHSRMPLSLDVPALRATCEVILADMLPGMINREPATMRNAFIIKCGVVSHYVATGEKIEGGDALLAYYKQAMRAE